MPWLTADNQGPPPCTCSACKPTRFLDPAIVPTSGPVTVQTPYGPLTIPHSVWVRWRQHGWPSDSTLREMVHNQHKETR